jgi:hypothetical protein
MKGKPAAFGEKVGRIVYESMVETINVPEGDRFQVVTEHERSSLLYDPGYLGIQRSALYQRIAERLNVDLGVRIEDVFINVVEVKKENWSFGNGIAQYVT